MVISTAVIISFVWYFNPQSRYSRKYGLRGGSDEPVGSVYGEPIPRSKFMEVRSEAYLAHLFQYGEWPRNDEGSRRLALVDQEIRRRLIFLHKLKDYNIDVSDDAVADWIVTTPAFKDPQTKSFKKEGYESFIANLPKQGLTKEDFERFARHQIGIQHLAAMVAVPGKLVTPQEAESTWREENQKADTKIVLFNSSNYLAQVEVKPEAITNFYNLRGSSYRLPERVQVSYVVFPSSNYFPQAEQLLAKETNLTQQIDAMYAQRGPNFYTDADRQIMTPEAAKAKIRQEVLEDAAKVEARRAANGFLEKVLLATNIPAADRIEQVAQQNGLKASLSEPFGQFEPPKGLNVPDQFSKVAFMLSPAEPIYEEPIVGEDAVYAVGFKRRIESQMPPLASVQDKVVEDYRRTESQRLARQAGLAFATAATNAIAGGKNFDQAAQEAGLSVIDIAPFSHEARAIPEVEGKADASDVRTTAFSTKPGQASNFRPSREGGYVLFVEKIIPAAEDELKKDLPTFVEELRRRRGSDEFQNWFAKEMMAARVTLAGDKKGGPGEEDSSTE